MQHKILLIETSPPNSRGSMRRYADLIESIFSDNADSGIQIRRLNLSPPEALINFVPAFLRMWAHHGWIMLHAALKLPFEHPDLCHIIDGSHAYVARWIRKTPSMATAHDVIPLLQNRRCFAVPPPGRAARELIRLSLEGLKRVDHVISDSENTKNDLILHAGVDAQGISVLHIALAGSIERANRTIIPWQERMHRPDAYIFHVGNNGFYKNRSGVIQIFAKVREKVDIRLVMAGPAPTDGLVELAGKLKVADHIEFVEDPDDESLIEWYRNASLFLFPSIYEGFGWPPLEAMALGCPVVCSSAASLSEVAQGAALTSAPHEIEKMAHLCIRALSEERLAEDLIGRGLDQVKKFGAQQMKEGLTTLYLQTIRESRHSRRRGNRL